MEGPCSSFDKSPAHAALISLGLYLISSPCSQPSSLQYKSSFASLSSSPNSLSPSVPHCHISLLSLFLSPKAKLHWQQRHHDFRPVSSASASATSSSFFHLASRSNCHSAIWNNRSWPVWPSSTTSCRGGACGSTVRSSSELGRPV